MRVLHFYKTYLPDSMGGIEQVIFQMSESGARHGVDSTVLTLSNNPAPGALQIREHQVHQARMDFQLASTCLLYTSPSPRDS